MKIVKIGHFFKGEPIGGWEFRVKEGLVSDWFKITEDGKVMVNGVEIVPWTEARKKSMDGKNWVKA